MIQYLANTYAFEDPLKYVIRAMSLEDIDVVQKIDKLSFSLPWPESAFRYELLENPRSMVWVAETKDWQAKLMVVGVVVVWLILDEAHIATLAVHPDYRRKSLARNLLMVALREANDLGATSATLEVRETNLSAQSLYTQLGFDVVGRRRHYYKDTQEDAVLMTLYNIVGAKLVV